MLEREACSITVEDSQSQALELKEAVTYCARFVFQGDRHIRKEDGLIQGEGR